MNIWKQFLLSVKQFTQPKASNEHYLTSQSNSKAKSLSHSQHFDFKQKPPKKVPLKTTTIVTQSSESFPFFFCHIVGNNNKILFVHILWKFSGKWGKKSAIFLHLITESIEWRKKLKVTYLQFHSLCVQLLSFRSAPWLCDIPMLLWARHQCLFILRLHRIIRIFLRLNSDSNEHPKILIFRADSGASCDSYLHNIHSYLR